MRSIFTDEAPVPEITAEGMVSLHIDADGHPPILTHRDVARRFCSDLLFLIDEYERKAATRKPGKVCHLRKPPTH